MRILYIASGIPVPGTLGGSTHAFEVARGLAERGHQVHLVAASCEDQSSLPSLARPVSQPFKGFLLHHLDIPKAWTWLAAWPVLRLARAVHPDAIMERYYNFAGVGMWAAHRLGIPCLLEVNALLVDPPEVPKRRIDDATGGWMRRWAVTQCRWADRIVTPLHTTVPPEVPRDKIVQLPWGASTERFPNAPLPPDPLPDATLKSEGEALHKVRTALGERKGTRPHRPPTAVFLGSFRNWHGVIDVVKAGALLLTMGRDYHFLLVGDGPERPRAEQLARAWPGRFRFTGAVPYEEVPTLLRQATVGVAPFTRTPHPALRAAGFFWSPLKIYEYMAASLPVVTTNIPPLNTIIREQHEGALFREDDVGDLAAALDRLLCDPLAAWEMGARARVRVRTYYSWAGHCTALERVLQEIQR